ncbi:uncharacterized protein [Maniola hyperantus]|uniref:uncharacterized protein n=1 Tax=Aphantopus hyperantus TaxID=2795564 RepID=UPI00213437ED
MSQTSDTAKLIEKVRLRNYLYDLSDTDYKNREKKADAWISIANEMGYESGVYWSAKWKSLRDNYNKFKKTKQESTAASNKKYRNWPWADHMKFLDDFSYTRPYLTNLTSQNDATPNKPSTSHNSATEEEETQLPDTKIIVKNIELKHRRHKMKTVSKKLGQKRSFDEVDLFFLSYAKNFKRLSRKSQALMKVEIASLFTRYELQDENDTDVQTPAFQNFGLFTPSVSCIYDNDNSD